MPTLTELHHLNIIIHVSTGSLAICLGLWLLSRPKGDDQHRRIGRIAVAVASICVGAAWIGAFGFRGKPDLMGVSILTAYQLWSGLRSLHLKNNGRSLPDLLPALGLVSCGAAVAYVYQQGGVFNWEPSRVYATVGGIVFYGLWDSVRCLFPAVWRVWLNPAEHAFKMISLIGAMISVALATVLKGQSAYVALLASAVLSLLAFVFAVRAARRALR